MPALEGVTIASLSADEMGGSDAALLQPELGQAAADVFSDDASGYPESFNRIKEPPA